MRKPNLFIIGGEKCGTTWLYDQLTNCPEIYTPQIKEINFFNTHYSNGDLCKNYLNGSAWYKSFFKEAKNEKYLLDSSPMYLYDGEVPGRILKEVGRNIKIIVLVRDPIKRSISHFNMSYHKGDETRSISDSLGEVEGRYIQRSFYSKYIEKFVELFGRENVLVYKYEDIFRNKNLDNDISAYLDIPIGCFNFNYTIYVNKAHRLRFRWIYKMARVSSRIVYDHKALLVFWNWLRPLRVWVKSHSKATAKKLELDKTTYDKIKLIFREEYENLKRYNIEYL